MLQLLLGVVRINFVKQTQTSLCIDFDDPRCYDIPYFRRRQTVDLILKRLVVSQIFAFIVLSEQFKLPHLQLPHDLDRLLLHRLSALKLKL